MSAFWHDLGPALAAELLKLKRTLALALAVLAPLLVVLLNLLVYWQRGSTMVPPGKDAWRLLAQNDLIFWSLLVLPLFITLETALLAAAEHGPKTWKHLFALPTARGALYAAKQIVALALIGISSLVLWAGILGTGLLLRLLRPGIGLEQPAPLWTILGFVALGYLASWLLVAIHTWIAMHWSSFVVAMSVGVAATLVGIVVAQSDNPFYFPWTWPGGVMMEAMAKGTVLYGWLVLGCLGGILGALVGALEFTRRDVL
jgi:hypothetical protein